MSLLCWLDGGFAPPAAPGGAEELGSLIQLFPTGAFQKPSPTVRRGGREGVREAPTRPDLG